ncbi:MAG: C40 family peptidase [candidate division KSB1 bacterium]|nr:C40 family peptidase [candidate division KSB1 bacterium]MDZ7301300.1 C40 family peptidase [candidate division KSB1 bacterium]MDZ7310815.1 C40 family peptidase [candidate division KSB1 bacterium]
MFGKHYKFLVTLLLFLAGCESSNRTALQTQIEATITATQKVFVPDRRLDVFDAQVHFENGAWLIRGETTMPAAKTALIKAVDSLLAHRQHKTEIALLPDSTLGDSTQALIRVSVANLRKQPRHSAELVDQLLMGTPIKLLKEDGGWYLIQTPYRYLGWMESLSFVRQTSQEIQAWTSDHLLRFEEIYGTIRTQPNVTAQPVADLVMGGLLMQMAQVGNWTRVQLPDGREGFLPAASLRRFSNDSHKSKPTREAIVTLSKRFMGIPYLWGGNSIKGFDCSGFTQTVFKMHGLPLPRDANQQVQAGVGIVPDENFSNVLPGDLLFFGIDDRITHVGISLGGAQFIHASGDVHLNSLKKEDANYNEFRRNTFKQVRRVLND